MAFIYIPKYLFLTCLAYYATESESEDTNWLQQNAFAIVQLGYNLGQFLGKGSLHFFKLFYIEISTSIMIISIIVYAPMIYYFELPLAVHFMVLMFVGFNTGVAYCSSIYLVMEDKNLG